MKALHFGAGNIGRGFIGEVYFDNNYEIVFVDVNAAIIDAINTQKEIEILYAQDNVEPKFLSNIKGINSKDEYALVLDEFMDVNLVTTSIGANNLKYVAPTIAEGLKKRMETGIFEPLDVIACENLINGSQILKSLVLDKASVALKQYIETWIGFPNAAIDRIVPEYVSENVLSVKVERFREWIVERIDKKSDVELESVIYVDELKPYIERKLFSVNTGHAALAYAGLYYGHDKTLDAIEDYRVLLHLRMVLNETSYYLIHKYDFDVTEHQAYIEKLIQRFSNPKINDDLNRIARNPIRKLAFNERIVKPLRRLASMGGPYNALLKTIMYAVQYENNTDAEVQKLHADIDNFGFVHTLQIVTGLPKDFIDRIYKLT